MQQQHPVRERLRSIIATQGGMFTRAQAQAKNINDMALQRALDRKEIERVDHGVYRLVGADTERHSDIRSAWFRLSPTQEPFERLHHPQLWVSHRSAARLHDLGVFQDGHPEFISTRHLQPRFPVTIKVRRQGLPSDEWTIVDQMPVTTVTRTYADLVDHHPGHDPGHLGRYAEDAINRGMATLDGLQAAAPAFDLDAALLAASRG